MKVSIVTLSFNQALYLEHALRSVTSQDYPSIEYIVMDPGSKDDSRAVIERYRDTIAKVILDPDGGPADALNRGFANATGDIFGFLNADDELLPHAVSSVVRAFQCMPEGDVISGHALVINAAGRVLRKFYSRRFSLLRAAYGAAVLAQSSTFFRSTAYRATRGFNAENRVAWDGELWVDLAMSGARFCLVDDFLSSFRVHPHSITGSGRMHLEDDAYSRRIFRKIMGREKRRIDRPIRWALKGVEYLLSPRAFIERITKGRTTSQ